LCTAVVILAAIAQLLTWLGSRFRGFTSPGTGLLAGSRGRGSRGDKTSRRWWVIGLGWGSRWAGRLQGRLLIPVPALPGVAVGMARRGSASKTGEAPGCHVPRQRWGGPGSVRAGPDALPPPLPFPGCCRWSPGAAAAWGSMARAPLAAGCRGWGDGGCLGAGGGPGVGKDRAWERFGGVSQPSVGGPAAGC
jgi:hypothetical protein